MELRFKAIKLKSVSNCLLELVRNPYFIIFFVVLLVNWQIALGWKCLQWDIINFWHPWRYFISECYNHGMIPGWNPYSQSGYPMHGDLQGPAYNPEAIFTSLLFKSSVYLLNYIFIGYLVIGGWGFYKLALYFIERVTGELVLPAHRNKTAVIAGLLYSMNGYNTGFGHYLYITISIGLLPWVFLYFFKLLKGGSYKDACKLAVFLFLQATAGNPSFLIICGYFFILITLCRGIQLFHRKNRFLLFDIGKKLGLAFGLFTLMSSPVILNALYIFQYTSRSGGLDLAYAADEKFIFPNFFTFFSSILGFEREYQAGDKQPIFSFYIGILTFFFAIRGMAHFRSIWVKMFSVLGILAFLLSLGMQTPLYNWVYHYLPGFNVFRMPRLIFIYPQISILLLAGVGMFDFLIRPPKFRHLFAYCILYLTASFSVFIYSKYIYKEAGNYEVHYNTMRAFLWSASLEEKSLVFLLFSILAFIPILLFGYKKNTKALIWVLVVDVFINFNISSIGRNFSNENASVLEDEICHLPKNFPVPENISGKLDSQLTNWFTGWWMNIGIFLKRPFYENQNNFELKNYMKLINGKPSTLSYFASRDLAFLSDTLVNRFDSTLLHSKKNQVIVDTLDFIPKNIKLEISKGDIVRICSFLPGAMQFHVKNKLPVAFVVKQNYLPLWHIKVDGKEVLPHLCYYSFPLLLLKGGEHEICFDYVIPELSLLLGVALTIFVLLCIFLIFRDHKILCILFISSVFCCCYRFFSGKNQNSIPALIAVEESILNHQKDSNSMYVSNAPDASMPPKSSFFHYNFCYQEDFSEFIYQLTTRKPEFLNYICYNSYHPNEYQGILRCLYGTEIESCETNFGFIAKYKRSREPALEGVKILMNSTFSPEAIVDTHHEWGPGYATTIEKLNAKTDDLIFATACVECDTADFQGLCLSLVQNGKIVKSIGKNFVHYSNRKKQRLSLMYRIPQDIRDEDELKVFIWNNLPSPLKVSEMEVIWVSGKKIY